MGRNERLISARHRAGMSQAELAEAVNTWLAQHRARSGALDDNYIGRLERGAVRRPGRDYREAFRAVLGAGTDQSLGFHPPRNGQSVDPGGVLTSDDAERLATGTDRAGMDLVAQVLARVRRQEDETSAATVMPTVLAQRDLADRLARESSPGDRSAAVGLLSEINQYLGWLLIPQGQMDESRRWLDRAAVLGLEADDPQRVATALSFRAYSHLYNDAERDLQTASSLSVAALRDTRIDPGLRTYLSFQRAEILAASGDKRRAVRLLSEADRMIDHLPPPEELPPSGYWYTAPFFLGQRAFVLRALDDWAAARRSAQACLDAMPVEWATSEWASRRRRLADGDEIV